MFGALSRELLMNIKRSFIAAASSLLWPAVILAIPMGITFGAARVYAESSPEASIGTPECTDSKVTACADAGAMQACDCGVYECACIEKRCSTGSSLGEALICEHVSPLCANYALAECEGKAPGDPCAQSDNMGNPGVKGACASPSTGCYEKNDAGIYERTARLACIPSSSLKDDVATAPGCSTNPGALGTSTLLAIPLGLGLALARRRKRRRSPRK